MKNIKAAESRKELGCYSGYEGHSLYRVIRGKKMKFTFKDRNGDADFFPGKIPV
jgi:hypothetical protein